MTDACNAVLDGVHCIMLSQETAIGDFPVESVATLDAIARNAEAATNYRAQHTFIKDFMAKPLPTDEAVAAAAAALPLDGTVSLVMVVSESGRMASLVSKFKSSVPILVVTTDAHTAACTKVEFAQYPCLIDFFGSSESLPQLIFKAVGTAKQMGIYSSGSVAVVHGANEPDCEIDPVIQVWSASQFTNI